MKAIAVGCLLALGLSWTYAGVVPSRTVQVVNLPLDGSGNVKVSVAGTRAFRFVGVTSQRFGGNGTRAVMTAACYEDFHGSRMAFSDEYALSINPAQIAEPAWVQPRIAFGQATAGTLPIWYDAAGNRVLPEYSCGYWTSDSSSLGGTVLLPSGALNGPFSAEPCSNSHPVACVAAE